MIKKDPLTSMKCKKCGNIFRRKVWDYITMDGAEDAEYCSDCGLKIWVDRFQAPTTNNQKRR